MPQREPLRPCQGALLLLLLACLGGLVLGEVGDFSACVGFFHNESPPAGVSAGGYQPICQRYKNRYRFASLYYRQGRTPLYSAYTLTAAAGKRPTTRWMYEPQLSFSGASPEMLRFPHHRNVSQNVKESQAVLLDYTNSSYTKGHLNPSLHHHDKDDRTATFTLTNIVPQKKGSNSGPWATLEREVMERLEDFCLGRVHVITGALPYLSEQRWINNRVAVPEYVWSAYCCPRYNTSMPESVRPLFPTYAAIGRNDHQSGGEIVPVDPKSRAKGYDVRQMSLNQLEDVLRQRLAMPISLFQQQCQSTRLT